MTSDHASDGPSDIKRRGAAVSRRSALRGLTALAAAGSAFAGQHAVAAPHMTVLVATTRQPANGLLSKWFGSERGATTTLARARLQESDGGPALSGLRDFTITAVEPASRVAGLFAETRNREVLVYVHGFNTTFENAVVSGASLSDGVGFAGQTVVFTWPSRGTLFDYGYDRDSAMLSRRPLVQALDDLLASEATGRVNVVAHSIGTMLATQAMFELYKKHGAAAADRFGAIVLAAPDIDMDVFAAAIPQMGPLVAKITVVTATDDLALAVSQIVNGGTVRVGKAEAARLKRLGLLVIDGSQKGWDVINHNRFMSNADIRREIHEAMDRCRGFWGCGQLTPAQK